MSHSIKTIFVDDKHLAAAKAAIAAVSKTTKPVERECNPSATSLLDSKLKCQAITLNLLDKDWKALEKVLEPLKADIFVNKRFVKYHPQSRHMKDERSGARKRRDLRNPPPKRTPGFTMKEVAVDTEVVDKEVTPK